jgi:hypothetical protein
MRGQRLIIVFIVVVILCGLRRRRLAVCRGAGCSSIVRLAGFPPAPAPATTTDWPFAPLPFATLRDFAFFLVGRFIAA